MGNLRYDRKPRGKWVAQGKDRKPKGKWVAKR